jgi:hypothetical protein
MNNLGRKSDNPLAYPQSRLTNMFTNLGAEVYVIVLTIFAGKLGAAAGNDYIVDLPFADERLWLLLAVRIFI